MTVGFAMIRPNATLELPLKLPLPLTPGNL